MKNIILFVVVTVILFALSEAMHAGSLFAQGVLFTVGVGFVVWCVRVVRDVR